MTNAQTETTATIAERGAQGASEKAPSKDSATKKKGAPRGSPAAKGAKTKGIPKKAAKSERKGAKRGVAKKNSAARPQTKGAKIIEMLGRAKGATLSEIMAATDWQAHSVRGFLSIAAKKHSLKIQSTRDDKGVRTYTIGK